MGRDAKEATGAVSVMEIGLLAVRWPDFLLNNN